MLKKRGQQERSKEVLLPLSDAMAAAVRRRDEEATLERATINRLTLQVPRARISSYGHLMGEARASKSVGIHLQSAGRKEARCADRSVTITKRIECQRTDLLHVRSPDCIDSFALRIKEANLTLPPLQGGNPFAFSLYPSGTSNCNCKRIDRMVLMDRQRTVIHIAMLVRKVPGVKG